MQRERAGLCLGRAGSVPFREVDVGNITGYVINIVKKRDHPSSVFMKGLPLFQDFL